MTPAGWTVEALEQVLLAEVSARLGIPRDEVDWNVPVADYGLDSAEAVSLAHDLETQIAHPVDPGFFYEYPTIAEAAVQLCRMAAASPDA